VARRPLSPSEADQRQRERFGLAPLPGIVFEEPPFQGVLTPVLTDYPLGESTLYAVYISRRHLPLKIRAFIDSLIEASATTPVRKLAAAR
jgi:DNA-binding transcriptional LysR family regulator